MLDNKVGGLPVVDDAGKLVGIISDHDVFKAMVDITGARLGGLQFAVELPDQPGTARPCLICCARAMPAFFRCSPSLMPMATAICLCACATPENEQSEQSLLLE